MDACMAGLWVVLMLVVGGVEATVVSNSYLALNSGAGRAPSHHWYAASPSPPSPSSAKRAPVDHLEILAPTFEYLHAIGSGHLVEQLRNLSRAHQRHLARLGQQIDVVAYLNQASSKLLTDTRRRRSIMEQKNCEANELDNRNASLYRTPFDELKVVAQQRQIEYLRTDVNLECTCSGSFEDAEWYVWGDRHDTPAGDVGSAEATLEIATFVHNIVESVCMALPIHPYPINIGCFFTGITGAVVLSAELALYVQTACMQYKKDQIARSLYQLNTLTYNELSIARKIEIESLLAANIDIASFMLPNSMGGALEQVSSVVIQAFENFKTRGDLERDTQKAVDTFIAAGNTTYKQRNWAGAYTNYQSAYRTLIGEYK